ncbi:uncharacterized protein EAE97_008197 [Botrytis byssoidea]|uniref:Uncharacterized protein n=1 Tax=Botrytis byssoidea TaxID=139641 RepID=A0A9P5IC95_9HELO|nr:uncharacterized protein EAE97_008197 [Botrytis byssoidea]KAF7935290.1 hypothetical protein EAE97_008197 [Botrytis byssoidea]
MEWALIDDIEEARCFLAILKTEFDFFCDTLLRLAVDQLDVVLEEVISEEVPTEMGSSNGIKAGKYTGILSDDKFWLSYQGRITQQWKGKNIDREHIIAELSPPSIPKEHYTNMAHRDETQAAAAQIAFQALPKHFKNVNTRCSEEEQVAAPMKCYRKDRKMQNFDLRY